MMKRKFTILSAAFALLAGLMIPLGMWGQSTAGFTLTGMPSGASSSSTSGTITGSLSETWNWSATFSSGATSSAQNSSWQIGSSSKPCTQAVFSTSGISGTITNIAVNCGTKNAAGKVNCTVGGSNFGTQNQSTGTGNNPTNYGTTPSFSGSASGEIIITITNTQTYISIKSITVTYTTGGGGGTTYNVNIANNITGGSISASPTSQQSGQSVTLTATPNDAYTFNNIAGNWSVTYGDNQTIQVTPGNGNTATFEMPASAVTVTATFTPKPTHSITIASGIENGSVTASPTSAYEGQTVTLTVTPETGYALNTLTATYVNGSGETQTFNISNNTFQMPNADVTINATFISNTFEGTFEKYTETIAEGDYLLVYGNKAMNNDNSTNSGKLQGTSVSPVNDNITNPDRSIVWHIAPSATSGYWTIYNTACNKYVSGGTSNTNINLIADTTDNNGPKWTVTGTTTHDFRSKANEGQSTERFIRYYNSVYGNYASSNGGPLTLYKLKPSVAPIWSSEFPTTASILTSATYELTVSDFVSGEPAPTITLTTEVPSNLYEFEDGEFMFSASTADTYEFTFTATNSAGSNSVTLTITVTAPVQVNYYYSVNGVLDNGTPITQGQSATLTSGSNLNSEFVFVGWTTDPSDVDNILAAGSSQTINAETTFYAIYSRTMSKIETKVVILDGEAPELTSTAHSLTLSENGFSYYSSSAKYQALGSDPENNISSGKTILIGKQGAYLYNTTAFGNGITKFEIYANVGAAAAATAGVYFSTSTIEAYQTGNNTWESDPSGMGTDNLFDASSAIPSGAKYFWYQVTNDRNTQVQFRITYTETTSTTTKYTRVFLNETVSSDIEIVGPSIIPSGQMLDMGNYMLDNMDPANLIIEDGAQLYTDDVVEATIKKNIAGYTVGTNDTTASGITYSDHWYFISYPVNCDYDGDAPTGVTNMIASTPKDYDLYELANPMWENYKVHDFTLYTGHGYLYANANNVTLEFAGSLNFREPDPDDDFISLDNTGWNLVGNPFAYNTYPSMSYYMMNSDGTGVAATEYTTADPVAPCTGILVNSDEGLITFSKNAPTTGGGAKGGINLGLAKNERGAAQMDNAIVSFNEGGQLAKFYFGSQNANLYIPQGIEEYAIVSSEAQGEMPVNFRANENGQYTLTVNPENVEMNYLHLIDNMTGMDVDLLAEPSYTFSAKTTDYESRFKLVFFANTAIEDNSNETFAFFSDGQLIVNGEGTLQIFDALGRQLMCKQLSTLNCQLSTVNYSPGVYMLRLVNGDNVKVQKVVVR